MLCTTSSEWGKICKAIDYMDSMWNCAQGEFDNGVKIALGSTTYGDGEYFDHENNSYSVGSETLGIIRLDDISVVEGVKLGNVFTFEDDFYFESDEGKFCIADTVYIDTSYSYSESDDDYEYEYTSDDYFEDDEE